VRGQGHTTFGQAQVEGGLVIDMSSLNQIHTVTDKCAVVDAGVTWRRLLTLATARGRTPPVLTGFQGLSVGGTLSVGGISGVSYKRGAQIDHTLGLDVVTGEGSLVTCSAEHHRDLFAAVLGGGGRVGIIARAHLPLVPAPSHARHTLLSYSALGPFLRDMRELVYRASFDGVSGTIGLNADGSISYGLNALTFYSRPDTPETPKLFERVGASAWRATTEFEYVEYCLLVDRLIDQLQVTGGWNDRVHPWLDLFLPDAYVERYLGDVLPTLDPCKDVGPPQLGPLAQIHLFPLLTENLRRPWLRVPPGKLVFLFDILTSSHGPVSDPTYASQMVERNRRLFEKAREFGATPYSITAIPFSTAERIEQMGSFREDFEACKAHYDPFGILRGLHQGDLSDA
jgi:FAD/FMN-containing dehydrogenase